MDVKIAAHATLGIIPQCHGLKVLPPACDAVTAHRLQVVLDRIEAGQITGDAAFFRLGWVQGALCARGAGRIEEFKAINHQT